MFPVTGTVFIDVHDDYIDIRCTYASLHQGTITEFPDQFYHFPHIKKTEKGIPVCMTVSSRQGLPEDALALIGKDAENFGEQHDDRQILEYRQYVHYYRLFPYFSLKFQLPVSILHPRNAFVKTKIP